MEKILLDELSNIISAYKEGKVLQFYTSYGEFKDVSAEEFDIKKWYKEPKKFQIKPEVKYRPFADVEECWKEMQKHQPFGWVKSKDEDECIYYSIYVTISDTNLFKNDFREFTFADGTPFGIKEE